MHSAKKDVLFFPSVSLIWEKFAVHICFSTRKKSVAHQDESCTRCTSARDRVPVPQGGIARRRLKTKHGVDTLTAFVEVVTSDEFFTRPLQVKGKWESAAEWSHRETFAARYRESTSDSDDNRIKTALSLPGACKAPLLSSTLALRERSADRRINEAIKSPFVYSSFYRLEHRSRWIQLPLELETKETLMTNSFFFPPPSFAFVILLFKHNDLENNDATPASRAYKSRAMCALVARHNPRNCLWSLFDFRPTDHLPTLKRTATSADVCLTILRFARGARSRTHIRMVHDPLFLTRSSLLRTVDNRRNFSPSSNFRCDTRRQTLHANYCKCKRQFDRIEISILTKSYRFRTVSRVRNNVSSYNFHVLYISLLFSFFFPQCDDTERRFTRWQKWYFVDDLSLRQCDSAAVASYVSLISTTHKINDTSIMTLPVFVNLSNK